MAGCADSGLLPAAGGGAGNTVPQSELARPGALLLKEKVLPMPS